MKLGTVRLKDITLRITKGTTPTTIGHDFVDHGINFIKAEALNGDNELLEESFAYIDETAHSKLKRSILQDDDVLVTIAGVNIGKVGIIKNKHLPANTNQAVGIVRLIKSKANSIYIYYWFKNPATFNYLQNINAQAAQPNINLEMLGSLSLVLPSLVAQNEIVSILSVYDDFIANNRKRIQLLEEAARLLFREWFVYFRFPGHKKIKIVDGAPGGWKVAKVKDLGKIVTGKTPSKKDSRNFNGNVPFIKTPNMHQSLIILNTEETLSETGAISQNNKYLPPWSVLVSCIGTVGVVSMNLFKSQTNQQINSVIPKNKFYRYYSFFCLSNIKPLLEAIGGGSTMANINKNKFENIRIHIPSENVLSAFHETVDPIFKQIALLSMQNQKLAQARDLLLPRLMSGTIQV